MTKTNYWKHPTYGHVYCGDIASPSGRLIWPNLIKPKDAPPPKEGQAAGAPRYEVSLLLSKTDPKVIEFVATLDALVAGGLKEFNNGRSATIGINSVFGKNGDGDLADLEKYPYYKGCWVLVARNAMPSQVVAKDRTVTTADAVKGGMLGRLVITPLITAHGVSYKLLITQLIADDGVRYGGGSRDVADLLTDLECDDVPEPTVEQVKEIVKEAQAAPIIKKAATGKGKEAAVNLLA